MIYDKLCCLDRYLGLSKNLDTAIAFLQTADLSDLPAGRVEIDGDAVFGNHFSYSTTPLSQDSAFESHIRYLDLHIALSGKELIAIAPQESLQAIQALEEEDCILLAGKAVYSLPVDQQTVLLLYPGEAHIPKLTYSTPEKVDKLVIKIAL